jgi:hypothetical protein
MGRIHGVDRSVSQDQIGPFDRPGAPARYGKEGRGDEQEGDETGFPDIFCKTHAGII